MEEIYVEPEKCLDLRPSANGTGSRSSERRFHGALVLCLGLLSVCLLAFRIGFSVHSHGSSSRLAAELSAVKANLTERLNDSDHRVSLITADRDQLNISLITMTAELNRVQSLSKQNRDSLAAEFSAVKANLTERLKARDRQISSMSAERERLNASLIAKTEELNRIQSLSKQKKTCPTGWRKFSCSCYFLSSVSGSWERGRDDCRAKGADLVVIDSDEEQTFVSGLTQQSAWIGLNDREREGTWKWIDDSPLIKTYWRENQPDNGGGDPQWGEEDCVHFESGENSLWNDRSCSASLHWICEKIP
ncbi:hypothetical protein Q5P01_013936 [Channa striata]|uniref:C-type lectin domain-containing protein n=1 Tax=Channa striata TaxID=64152 RepID=A0AA88SR54_CHASR|nr:hypothetical protein Q5P01_013936 [Channa striata]